jgi:hypothetical protein
MDKKTVITPVFIYTVIGQICTELNFPACRNISGDSIRFDARVKNPLAEGAIVVFKGTGSVDWVKLWNNAGTLKLREEFSLHKKSSIEWF